MTVKIVDESHVDHGLSEDQLKYVLSRLEDVKGFAILTVVLPGDLGKVPSALYGPAAGDKPVPESDVHYGRRGERSGNSRLINKPMRKTSKVTAIVGPDGEDPVVLYTAFGGPQSPKEPTDPTLKDSEQEESEKFWSQHALASQS